MADTESLLTATERASKDLPPVPRSEKALRWGLIVISVFVVQFQCSGVILGWPNLELVLQREGLFSSDCGKHAAANATCPARSASFEGVSNTAFLALNLGNSIMGALLDLIGARNTAVLGSVGNAGAYFLLSYLNAKASDGGRYQLALSILAAAGFGPYLASFKWAVYMKYRSLYASIIASLFNSSALNFLVLYKLNLYDGVTRQQFFFWYAIACLAAIVFCFLFFPDDVGDGTERVRIPLRRFLLRCCGGKAEESVTQPKRQQKSQDGRAISWGGDSEPMADELIKLGPPWYVEARDPRFLYLLYWYAANNLMTNYTGSTIANQLQLLGDNGEYTAQFSLIANVVFVIFPLIGVLMEKTGFALAFLICQLLGIATLLSWLYLPLHLMPLGFSFYALYQGFLFPGFFAYLAVDFSMKNYGRLMAVATIFSTAVSTLDYAWSAIALQHGGSYYWPNMIQLIMAIPGLGFPVFLHYYNKKMEKRFGKSGRRSLSDYMEEDDRARSHIVPSKSED
eukprot:PLAT3881.2.p1 GENE.PLAT3881.2~~PLAT3881.2.p1  ORF type:complete len:512 (-),score=214.14 PLAT3881.2:130-1665(-)